MTYVIEQLTGLSRDTGELLGDHPHIHQSINDILTTPVGTRVMRRDYGSLVPELLDRPMTEALIMQIYAAIAIAVMKHEPRVRLSAVNVEYGANGQMVFTIDYERLHPSNAKTVGLYKFSVNRR